MSSRETRVDRRAFVTSLKREEGVTSRFASNLYSSMSR